jgi:hypothetical protein
MAQQPGTNRQVPEHAILDYFNKQSYLGNAFSFPINSQTINSTSETPIALIINPAVTADAFPSGYKSIFNNLRTTASDNSSGDDGTSFFRYYFNPTYSGLGTKTTPVNVRPASPTTSIANCYVNGQFTISANGTLVRAITAGYSSINDSLLLLILDPGNSLLVTAQCVTSGSTIINANSWWEL